tara:strand:+ start:307 stop:1602 length:1296 start_codon:yes stop_codon:yes gene_type:complete
MGWKKNRRQGELAFEGGFFGLPIVNELSSVVVDMLGVGGNLANTIQKPVTGKDLEDVDLDNVVTALDAAGMEPTYGTAADLASGLISTVRGDFGQAGLSLASLIPFVDVLTKPAKVAKMYTKHDDKLKAINKAIDEDAVFKETGKIDSKTLDKILDDSKIPKTLKDDIIKDKKTYDDIVNVLGMDPSKLASKADLTKKGPGTMKKAYNYMTTPSTKSMFGYRDKPWIPIRGEGKGFTPLERLVATNIGLNLADPNQGYFSDRGFSGQTSADNVLTDLLYSSTIKAPFEYGAPLVTGTTYTLANALGAPLSMTPEGSFQKGFEGYLQDRYDSTGMKIGESYPFQEEILNAIDPDVRPSDVKKKNMKNNKVEVEEIPLTNEIKNAYIERLSAINQSDMTYKKKQELQKEFYDNMPNKQHQDYLKSVFPRLFGN